MAMPLAGLRRRIDLFGAAASGVGIVLGALFSFLLTPRPGVAEG